MWVNAENVTLAKLQEKGGLWIVEALPEMGKPRINLFETEADTEDTDLTLMQRWVIGGAHKNRQDWLQAMEQSVLYSRPSMLVIHQAHRLPATTLKAMPMLVERFAPVLLVGDALKIGSKIVNDRDFMGMASFCVETISIFE